MSRNPIIIHENELMTVDFCVRSLRRRLWSAFQQDNPHQALQVYQASLQDLQEWLAQEEHEAATLQEKQEQSRRRLSKMVRI